VYNSTDIASSANGKIIDFRAEQGDKTNYETFLKTGDGGGFSVVFTPPSAETTRMTAKLLDDKSPVQETISVAVTESLLPLILIAVLLGTAIVILIFSWENEREKEKMGFKVVYSLGRDTDYILHT
jgi:hypothetical protein